MTKNAVWDEDELSTIQNVDRMLPSQPYFQKMYNGSDFYGDLQNAMAALAPMRAFDIKLKDGITYAALGSELNTLHFYQFLIRSHGFSNILELGTYIGVSAMYMAVAGAYVTTVEKGREFHDLAYFNVTRNWLTDKIDLVNRDAIEFLKNEKFIYDMILIDCAKESYKELLELSMPRLSKNGIILVDDVLFQGDTLNKEPTSEKGAGVKRMLEYVWTLEGWDKIMLPIGNGLLMLRRL